MTAMALSMRAGSTSWRCVTYPARAEICAMPCPIVPVPTTSTLRIAGASTTARGAGTAMGASLIVRSPRGRGLLGVGQEALGLGLRQVLAHRVPLVGPDVAPGGGALGGAGAPGVCAATSGRRRRGLSGL